MSSVTASLSSSPCDWSFTPRDNNNLFNRRHGPWAMPAQTIYHHEDKNFFTGSAIASDICVKDLEKFNADGSLKSKVSIYNKPLFESISREIAAISKVYSEVKDKGIFVNGDMFEEMIDRELHPEKVQRDSNSLLLPRFDKAVPLCALPESGNRAGLR